MKRYSFIAVFKITGMLFISGCQKNIAPVTGTVKVTFVNTVKGSPLLLNTQIYTNPFAETYTVSKYKYYISNLGLNGMESTISEANSYHLVDHAIPSSLSFNFEAAANTFSSISFTVGVDSIRNISGAQTGALDPLNDMFWTWNSGYIMAKLEGNSPQSTRPSNIIEYHIGGFKGASNVLKTITLNFPPGKSVNIEKGLTSEIIIEADLNSWWQSSSDLVIAALPVCTTPGLQAKNVADNYITMFTIKDVINKQ